MQRITFTGELLVYIKKLKELEIYFHENLVIQIVTSGIAVDKLADFALRSKLCIRISLNCANA